MRSHYDETPVAYEMVDRVNVLGVGVSAIDLTAALQVIGDLIDRRQPGYICLSTVHGIMECQRDPSLRTIYNQATLVTPDGMPLVWLSRLRGQRQVERVYGPDLLLRCCELFRDRGCRHYFYGGRPGVARKLADRLGRRFPGLTVAGVESPPFRPLGAEEDRRVVQHINAARPDILWIGLGTPKQERWMHDHFGRIEAPVMIGVGAAFDFHAGAKRQAPRWIQYSGFEWLFRLMSEPRRLWHRYLVYNPWFLYLATLQALGLRAYRLDHGTERSRSHPAESW